LGAVENERNTTAGRDRSTTRRASGGGDKDLRQRENEELAHHEYTPNIFHVIGDSFDEDEARGGDLVTGSAAAAAAQTVNANSQYGVYNHSRERTASAYVTSGRGMSENLKRDIDDLMMYTREACGESAFVAYNPEINLYEQATNEESSRETLI
jgi:hypothetical protein